MLIRSVLALGLLCSVGAGVAVAQTTAPETIDRSPVQGDPGAAPVHGRHKQTHARAAAIAKSDRQHPGTTNGNQPDRASAGGGGG